MYQLFQKQFHAHEHHNNISFSVSINHHPISKQNSIKYLGDILDDNSVGSLRLKSCWH